MLSDLDNKTLFSFAAGISKNNLDIRTNQANLDLGSFLKEIDEGNYHFYWHGPESQTILEIQTASGDPAGFEEAKAFISLKNGIIHKMRHYITNLSISKDSGLHEESQNVIQYLKYENERLENKLLLLNTELDVESSRAEQIKDVNNSKDCEIWEFFSNKQGF